MNVLGYNVFGPKVDDIYQHVDAILSTISFYEGENNSIQNNEDKKD